MAKILKVAVAQRQEQIPSGVNKNIYVRSYEFDAAVDRLNSITENDGTLIADTIAESTSAAGVTIDVRTLIKDGNISTQGAITSSVSTAGVGYETGAGGAVTQITSAVTSVTLNTVSGQITSFALTNAAGVDHSFTLTNSTIAATDVVIVSTGTYGGTADGIPIINVEATAAGSCIINVRNTGAVALDALVVINFAVIKAVAA